MTKVLVAEDNLTLLEEITLALEMRGYEVDQATDGQKALDILSDSAQLPDIIVSDIAMPDVDGFQLLEHLRNDPACNGLPFLFITAFDSPNSLRISKELGADDYIVKPFKEEDLILAIENKLKRIAAFHKQAEQNLDDARKTLLQMMAREIRSPLTAIYGGSEVLAESLANTPDATVHSMIGLIKNGADRLNRFTSKAQALLQIDSGYLKKTVDQSSLKQDICEVVRAAVITIDTEIAVEGRQVSISIDGCTGPRYVQGVFGYLLLMIEEPLRNAVAFSQDGTTVGVSVENDDDWVTVTIQDHGLGIPEADLHCVWERFSQIDRNRHQQQGAGLGLAIVRESARIHGGDCVIESEPDQGTRVIVSLPLARNE